MTQTTPAPVAPPQLTGQATDMLDLMMRLADLLEHETELVRAGQVGDIGALQPEKLRLSQLYQQTIRRLDAGGVRIIALAPPLRAQIVAASNRLAAAVAENERTLRIGRAATRRLKPVTSYTARRKASSYVPALAFAVDRRL